MKIGCIGGGIAALYFGIACKRLDPSHEVTIFERDEADKNSGWGIILKDPMLDAMRKMDETSHAAVLASCVSWNEIDIHAGGKQGSLPRQFGCSIGRHAFVQVLRQRAQELGVVLHYARETTPAALAAEQYDLLLGADGIKSRCRELAQAGSMQAADGHPDSGQAGRGEVEGGLAGGGQTDGAHGGSGQAISIERSNNRFVWLGCNTAFRNMVFDFRHTPHGMIWVHAYPFSHDKSTFVVECEPATFAALGFGQQPVSHDAAILKTIFSDLLGTADLLWLDDNRWQWRQFEQIATSSLHNNTLALVGDAAHTAHFSIGSGTRLAVEGAIALAHSLQQHGSVALALQHYARQRQVPVQAIQAQALNSMRWFDRIAGHCQRSLDQTGFDQFLRAFMLRSAGQAG